MLCNEIDQEHISYKIAVQEEQKCVLEVEMKNDNQFFVLDRIHLTVWIFEEQIIFVTSLLGNLTDLQRRDIFPIINNMNCDYSDFKFLLQESNNGYLLEMRNYLDVDLIHNVKEWYKAMHYFAVGLDLAFKEYAKELARFI